jgi:hypothetical protein
MMYCMFASLFIAEVYNFIDEAARATT